LFGATLAAGGLIALAPAAQAITIPVACSENALVAAVNLANTTTSADTLVLAGGCTYPLTSAHGGLTNGLPVITIPIAMIGPAVITRSSVLPFRFAEVSTTGSLTLTTSVIPTNGSDGGGILNRGAVALTNSGLIGNVATLNGGGLANADTRTGPRPPRPSPEATSPATPRC
jgi:hypothetical protein